jgi:hypothetical protein
MPSPQTTTRPMRAKTTKTTTMVKMTRMKKMMKTKKEMEMKMEIEMKIKIKTKTKRMTMTMMLMKIRVMTMSTKMKVPRKLPMRMGTRATWELQLGTLLVVMGFMDKVWVIFLNFFFSAKAYDLGAAVQNSVGHDGTSEVHGQGMGHLFEFPFFSQGL